MTFSPSPSNTSISTCYADARSVSSSLGQTTQRSPGSASIMLSGLISFQAKCDCLILFVIQTTVVLFDHRPSAGLPRFCKACHRVPCPGPEAALCGWPGTLLVLHTRPALWLQQKHVVCQSGKASFVNQ